jgi:hypothetical protein
MAGHCLVQPQENYQGDSHLEHQGILLVEIVLVDSMGYLILETLPPVENQEDLLQNFDFGAFNILIY